MDTFGGNSGTTPMPHKRASGDWTEEELQLIRENPGMSSANLAALMPNRSGRGVGNIRRTLGQSAPKQEDKPAVKAPGDYVETLSAYLVDEFDCMEIWLRWNGYSSYRELSRDHAGWVTILCTAK